MLAVIIPSIGSLDILGKTFGHIISYLPEGTTVVLSINPMDMEEAKRTVDLCGLYKKALCTKDDKRIEISVVWSDEPIGFANAVNKGYGHLRDELGLENFSQVLVMNDDMIPHTQFAENLITELKAGDFTGVYGTQPLEGKIDIISPLVSNSSSIGGTLYNDVKRHLNIPEEQAIIPPDAHQVVWDNAKQLPVRTYSIFGTCLLFSMDAIKALASEDYSFGGIFDNNNFKVGGFEDNDMMAKAFELGLNPCFSSKVLIDHKPNSTLAGKMGRGKKILEHCVDYLLKWEEETSRKKTVYAAYRVALRSVNEFNTFASSLARSAQVLDGAAIVLTSNPFDLKNAHDAHLLDMLSTEAGMFVDPILVEESEVDIGEYSEKFFQDMSENFNPDFKVKVHYWQGEWNERDERNKSHELAEEAGADWIISIDSDEVFEKRINRKHIDKCVNHPNPQYNNFRATFLNHYESQNLIRLDKPFAKGLFENQGGPRIFKVRKASPVRMVSGSPIGLHCGNTPDYGGMQTSSIRFNHYSHLKDTERSAKANWYNQIDENKNPSLIGNFNYNHISRKEEVPVSFYDGKSGIGFFMLAYEGEGFAHLFRHLVHNYAFVDYQCLVWTGEWAEEDRTWASLPVEEWPTREEWPETGPNWHMAQIARLTETTWLYHRYNGRNLSDCRNAAIEYYRRVAQEDPYLGWVLFSDPDETTYEAASICRMAETNHTAFNFRFKNVLISKEGKPTASFSETIRMFRLDNDGVLKFSGKVHESLENSLAYLHKMNRPISVPNYPHLTINGGLSGNAEFMAAKLTRYTLALKEQLEEDPYDGGAWTALALQLLNDQDTGTAKTCLEYACLSAPQAYLPYRELGLLHLNEARKVMYMALKNCNAGHTHYDTMLRIVQFLEEVSPQPLLIDTGDVRVSDVLDKLPDFPTDNINPMIID